jgi:phospholipid-binding lipoprotein MlaA
MTQHAYLIIVDYVCSIPVHAMNNSLIKKVAYTALVSSLLLLTGCTSSGARHQQDNFVEQTPEQNNTDPFEPFNRGVFAFNTDLDNKILIPIANGYQDHVPNPARIAIFNFFSNVAEGRNILQNLLQGKFNNALECTARLLVNSTVGMFGFVDIASLSGLPKHKEDLGQTLAVWGVYNGPYLVLPILGPSSARDVWGLTSYFFYTDPTGYLSDTGSRVALLLVDLVDTRSRLLRASSVFDQAAVIDPYIFQRESYLQLRENLIYDGRPPRRQYEFLD